MKSKSKRKSIPVDTGLQKKTDSREEWKATNSTSGTESDLKSSSEPRPAETWTDTNKKGRKQR